ncbi:Eaa family phage protein, partial [Trabulsiella guamensis ATCC 49490]
HMIDLARIALASLEAEPVGTRLPPRAPENLASCLDGYEKWLVATTFRDTWNACLAEVVRLSTGNSPVIPDGYVVVPVEPTTEMLRAGFLAGDDYPGGVYRAMIAAAPKQEV